MTGLRSLVSRRTAIWFAGWLACTLANLSLAANIKQARIDPDEIYWIGSAYYYHLAFEQGDLLGSHPDWKLLPARENPPVAKYVLGLGLALSGDARQIRSLDLLGSFYAYFAANLGVTVPEHGAKQEPVMQRMDPKLRENVSRSRQMYIDPNLLVSARRVMLICSAITSLLVFSLGAATLGRATGLLASQLLLLHPSIRFSYEHAMADAVGYMFGAAAALAAWLFIRRFAVIPRSEATRDLQVQRIVTRDVVEYAILNGILIGLAVGAKMNWLTVAFLFGAAVLAAALVAWWQDDRARAKRALVSGAGGLAIAFVVFVLINPAIVSDPWNGLVAVVREPVLTTAVQARVLPWPPHLVTLGAKLSAVGALMFGTPLAFALVMLLIALSFSRAPRAGMWFVAGWWLIAFVCVTAWIPFEWRRYVLPLVVPFALLMAHALVSVPQALRRRRARAQ